MHVLPVKSALLLATPAPSTLLCPPNQKHLLLSSDSDPKSQRKLYYDHCLPASTPINELYSNLNVDEYIQNVVQGYNSAIFTIGAGETKKFGVLSSQLYIQALLNLKDSLQKLNNVRLKYAFLGLSDARCVNLLQERGLQADALIKAIESIYEPVTSVDDIIAKFKQGSSLPFVLLIRVEKTGNSPLIGNLLLSDIGIVKFDTTDNLSNGPSLNKSFQVLRRIVSMLAQTSFMGPLPYSESVLTSVSADYFGGNGKTLCVFNTESSTPTPSPETLAALSFAESIRRVKNRFTKNSVDHRIYNLEKQLSEFTIQHNEFAQLTEKTEAEAQRGRLEKEVSKFRTTIQ
ncbi:P-loop containing nucleoside triphosphate hydrolase protein [Paraphysoderma sedebokerense]|nr:P-loop containing nucleoside triphosphate hydrolase protein [Paraphysoderma sedebokerense]